jgi:hypothetical protein
MNLAARDVIAWFDERCQRAAGGCKLYLGSCNRNGYPVGYIGGVGVPLRRVVYAAARGGVPSGKYLSMVCRSWNCLNPEHMRAYTRAEYMRKSVGGRPRPSGVVATVTAAQRRRPDCKLSMTAARAIRERAAAGESQVDIARDYKCSRASISMVISHKSWREPSPWAI